MKIATYNCLLISFIIPSDGTMEAKSILIISLFFTCTYSGQSVAWFSQSKHKLFLEGRLINAYLDLVIEMQKCICTMSYSNKT